MDLDETSSQGEEDETWDDFQEEAGQEGVQSLFSDARLPTIAAALQHDTRAFGFNFASFRKQASTVAIPPSKPRTFPALLKNLSSDKWCLSPSQSDLRDWPCSTLPSLCSQALLLDHHGRCFS